MFSDGLKYSSPNSLLQNCRALAREESQKTNVFPFRPMIRSQCSGHISRLPGVT